MQNQNQTRQSLGGFGSLRERTGEREPGGGVAQIVAPEHPVQVLAGNEQADAVTVEPEAGLQEQSDSLLRLSASIQALSLAHSRDDLLETVLSEARALTHAAGAVVLVCDPVSGEPLFTRSQPDCRASNDCACLLAHGVINEVAREQSPALIGDMQAELRYDGLLDALMEIRTRALLAVPLTHKDSISGALACISEAPHAFTEHDLYLLSALANSAAMALEVLRLLEAEREQLRRLAEAQEQERKSIAREIHDESSQSLTAMLVQLRLIEQSPSLPDTLRPEVVELKRQADEALDGLHRLAAQLRPPSLERLGLVAALCQHVKSVNGRQGGTVSFETAGLDGGRLPIETEIALYRIVQEALTNAMRHARASRVDVILERRGSELILIVEDNGAGFDPAALPQAGRLGLVGMRERAEMLGGHFSIESEVGKGTTLLVELPYERLPAGTCP